jgi:L-fucose mutarotase
MIKSVDPSLPSRVLFELWAMGHGDEVAVVDPHFIADWDAGVGSKAEIVRIDGLDSLQTVRAVLSAVQLDTTFVDHLVKWLDLLPDTRREVQGELDEALGFPCAMLALAYPEFYEHAKNCYVLIVTGSSRRWGSFILRKGLDVTPDTVCSTDGPQ